MFKQEKVKGISSLEAFSVLAVRSSPRGEAPGTVKTLTDLLDKISESPGQQALEYVLLDEPQV